MEGLCPGLPHSVSVPHGFIPRCLRVVQDPSTENSPDHPKLPLSGSFSNPWEHGLQNSLFALERKKKEIREASALPSLASLLAPPSVSSPHSSHSELRTPVTLLDACSSFLPE